MDAFLESQKILKVIQKEIKNLSRCITNKENEFVIKKLPIKKCTEQMTSLVISTKHLIKN